MKQENFVRNYVEVGCASKAYRHAYNTQRMKPATVHVEACKLLANPKVAKRVSELQEAARQRNEISFDDMLQMFLEDRELARRNNQAAAAISADNSIAKMLGFMSDKSEVKIEQTIEITHRQEEIKQDVMSIFAGIEAEKSANAIEIVRENPGRSH